MTAELDDTQPAASDSGPLLVSRISRFEVQTKLGEGGNGVVLLARDPALDRNVAIKILRRRDDADASQRLLREAQAAAKLAHENVIVIHEVGTHDGQVYVAMEHVPGGTLTQWQARKSPAQILDVYRRAGRGLAAAHAAGLVHRDFKPDNVLVGDDGRVRVTDFGLVAVSTGKPPDDVRDLDLTKTGTIMGTPRYMAPEQHLGEDVDERADQFAFCIALYEALCDQAPFAGETYGALADAVVAGEVRQPPASDLPKPLTAAILRGLSRDRADRFGSMPELLQHLVLPAPRRPRAKLVLTLGPLAALAIASTLLVLAVARHREKPVAASEPDAHVETALEAFSQAEDAFNHGNYAAAAAGFRHAFELEPDLDGRSAPFIFNMAASYAMLGDCTQAARFYREYLAVAKNPAPDEVARVEQAIQKCGSTTR